MPEKSCSEFDSENFGFIGDVNPTHRLGATDESTQIGLSTFSSTTSSSSCDSVTCIAGLGPAKNYSRTSNSHPKALALPKFMAQNHKTWIRQTIL